MKITKQHLNAVKGLRETVYYKSSLLRLDLPSMRRLDNQIRLTKEVEVHLEEELKKC